MCMAVFALMATIHFGAAWYVYWVGFLLLACWKQTGSTVFSGILLLAYHAHLAMWLGFVASMFFDVVIHVVWLYPRKRC